MSILDDQNILENNMDNALASTYYAPINKFTLGICMENMIGINKYNKFMIFINNHWVINEELSSTCLKLLIDSGAKLNDLQNDNITSYIENNITEILKSIEFHNKKIFDSILSPSYNIGDNGYNIIDNYKLPKLWNNINNDDLISTKITASNATLKIDDCDASYNNLAKCSAN